MLDAKLSVRLKLNTKYTTHIQLTIYIIIFLYKLVHDWFQLIFFRIQGDDVNLLSVSQKFLLNLDYFDEILPV